MGAAHSAETPKRQNVLNRAGNYDRAYLRERWKGTERDGYVYSVGYAPTGQDTCKECKQKIAPGALRVGRSSPNPFDAEGGASDYTSFFHAEHAFAAFARSRCGTSVPASVKGLTGAAIKPVDRRRLEAMLGDLVAARRARCNVK